MWIYHVHIIPRYSLGVQQKLMNSKHDELNLIITTIIPPNMTAKTIVRATRPTFLCPSLETITLTRKLTGSMLADDSTLKELNRTIEVIRSEGQ